MASCDPASTWTPLAGLLHAPKYQMPACRTKGRATVMHWSLVVAALLRGIVEGMQNNLLLSHPFVAAHTSPLSFMHARGNRVVSDHVMPQCLFKSFLMETTAVIQSCWDATVGMQWSQGVLQQPGHKPHLVGTQPEWTYSRCSTRFMTLSAAHVRRFLKSLSGLPLHACAQQSSCLPKDLIALIKPCSSDQVNAHSSIGGYTPLTCHRFVCLDQMS